MGGIITSALGGAGEGLEKGTNLAGGLYLKGNIEQETQRLAQDAQAEREQRNIRLTKTLERENEAAKPRIVPAGATERVPGQPDFQAPAAPEKNLSPEAIDLLKAQAEWYRKHGQAVLQDKQQKPTLPKIVPLKDEQGNTIAVLDENSGAYGVPTPGTPAQEAIGHWFRPDEPAKAAVPPGLQWYNAARQPIAGIHTYYPEMMSRVPASPAGPAAQPALADPLGLRKSLQPTPKPEPKGSQIVPTPTPVAAKPLTVEPYLGVARGGYMFSAPNRAGIAKQLNGRIFRTKQEAQAAYDALINQE